MISDMLDFDSDKEGMVLGGSNIHDPPRKGKHANPNFNNNWNDQAV